MKTGNCALRKTLCGTTWFENPWRSYFCLLFFLFAFRQKWTMESTPQQKTICMYLRFLTVLWEVYSPLLGCLDKVQLPCPIWEYNNLWWIYKVFLHFFIAQERQLSPQTSTYGWRKYWRKLRFIPLSLGLTSIGVVLLVALQQLRRRKKDPLETPDLIAQDWEVRQHWFPC